ncbi:hypothetical protein PBAL39_16656 [Pedobacter sp. BAL39]|uniref:hypothetical protein n=1 Tax=Pedobacter sp. BAL39 TaxID=391596 RepID=UPI000155A15C|nr:hypothetical protein [Pedobacter sp. BAL39]EDM35131.1 hypothetical protein PBAL39_16656 [Pedobacter sp. BAL39]
MKIFSPLLLLACLHIMPLRAQQKCLPLPDALGKELAMALLNHDDISLMPVFPDAEEMKFVENFQQSSPIAVVAGSEMDSPESNALSESWKQLLRIKQEHQINSSNTTYATTLYEQDQVVLEGAHINRYVLYVVLKQGTKNIAFNCTVTRRNDQWLLLDVNNDFYNAGPKRPYGSGITPLNWNEQLSDQTKLTAFAEPKSKRNPGWTSAEACLEEPLAFIKSVINDLSAGKPADQFSQLISTADFLKYELPDIAVMIDKAIATPQEEPSEEGLAELKALQGQLKTSPATLYSKFITDDLGQLVDYLKTSNFQPDHVTSIDYQIKNFDHELLSLGSTIMKADVRIKTGDAQEGFIFTAHWLNNKWMLNYVQSSTYSISETETTVE